jgi:alanyl-tRNA synthetase
LKNELQGNYLVCLTANIDGKACVAIAVHNDSTLDAGKLIKEMVTPLIEGGGGGNKNLATAGGTNVNRLQDVLDKVKGLLA